MSTDTTGTAETNNTEKPFVFPKPTLSKEEFAERIAEIRRRRNDPEYIARIENAFAESLEYRRQVDEEARRLLDEEEGK